MIDLLSLGREEGNLLPHYEHTGFLGARRGKDVGGKGRTVFGLALGERGLSMGSLYWPFFRPISLLL